MRVLLIKTSSMGDIIHTLPALTDAGQQMPEVRFDWVVEDAFTDIPTWHPRVQNIIPVALRRWRKEMFSRTTHTAWRTLRERLRANTYDMILDAQGLVKSAVLTFLTPGERVGLDWRSARESLASLAYQRKCTVNFYQHAVVRMRQLFSQALGYPLPATLPDFGIKRHAFQSTAETEKYVVFLHGTTWVTKQWPLSHWQALAQLAEKAGYRIKISGGNAEEIERAYDIAKASAAVDVLPRLSIPAMAALLANATAVVAVDTGLGHLAAALNVPTVSLYGATNPAYTGALGATSVHLATAFPCAPCLNRTCTYQGATAVQPACYATLSPAQVWGEMQAVL